MKSNPPGLLEYTWRLIRYDSKRVPLPFARVSGVWERTASRACRSSRANRPSAAALTEY